jgi:hypothetical protein
MASVLSAELRGRVVAAIGAGASRREAARRFEISPVSAERPTSLLERWHMAAASAIKAISVDAPRIATSLRRPTTGGELSVRKSEAKLLLKNPAVGPKRL